MTNGSQPIREVRERCLSAAELACAAWAVAGQNVLGIFPNWTTALALIALAATRLARAASAGRGVFWFDD